MVSAAQRLPDGPLPEDPANVIPFPRADRPDQPTWTFRRVFEELHRPTMIAEGRKAVTIQEFTTAIRRFDEWLENSSQNDHRITHPGVADVRQSHLMQFRSWLVEHERRWSNRTINKYLGSLTALLRTADQHDLIDKVRTLKPLPARKAARKLYLTFEEATALKRACTVARWPRGLPAPAALYWETLIVGWCAYGFRTQEQVRYEPQMRGLRWEAFSSSSSASVLDPDNREENALGWFRYVPQKQERIKQEPLVLPVCAAYHAHLEAIKRHAGGASPEGLIFPFPLSNKAFYRTWRAIIEAAGVQPRPDLDGLRPEYQIKHLRKTAARWLDDHGATIGHPKIAADILGHAPRGITDTHYTRNDRGVRETITSLPLPPALAEPLYGGPLQGRLF